MGQLHKIELELNDVEYEILMSVVDYPYTDMHKWIVQKLTQCDMPITQEKVEEILDKISDMVSTQY